MDGIPFRKLADLNGISPAEAYSRVKAEMNQLPDNTYLSAKYCNRWSGILNLDGKYVKVKRFDKKIPFVYGIDFLTHDLPTGLLAPSENEQVFLRFFRLLKMSNYHLRVVICDDLQAVDLALNQVYPQAKIQLCHNHFFENLRQYLSIRTSDHFQPFFYDLKAAFSPKHHSLKREALLAHVNYKYGRKNEILLAIMADIERRKDKLFAFQKIKNCPSTNNISESYNSHLNGRLKTIKGFNSYASAERWFNAWMIRRRTKNFTDCGYPFKHLNGKCSLEKTLKKDQKWPLILGIKSPKNALNSER